MNNSTQSEVIEPEVMPVQRINPNPLRFDLRTTVQSPFFWFTLGAGTATLLIWLAHRNGRKNS